MAKVKQGTDRRLEKLADKWLEDNRSDVDKKKKENHVIKSDENGILTERQLRSLSEEYESPISHFQADDEHNIFDWIQGQEGVEVVTESIATPKVADKEYVVSIVQAQVKPFMHSAGAEQVSENMALCYELVYNQGMNFTQASKVIGISDVAVRKNLIKFLTLAKVELYCGINVKDGVLEKFMHPSILALRNAKQRYASTPKVSKSDVAKQAEVYGLTAPTFNWTAQNGLPVAHPSTLTTEEKGLA